MPENQAQVPYIPLYAIDKHESSCGLSSMYSAHPPSPTDSSHPHTDSPPPPH